MELARLINSTSRILNKWIMLILALAISALLLGGDEPKVVIPLWIMFILISSIFSINGILLKRGVNREIIRLLGVGKPIGGIEGFYELEEALGSAQKQSYLITLTSILSFTFYLMKPAIAQLGETLALSMLLIAISISILVEYPEDPSLTPGGLVGYFEPDAFPLVLDNLLSDVFYTYLDPVTQMKYDDFTDSVYQMLVADFEASIDHNTRVERAIEKILLLAYLSFSNPHAFPPNVIKFELIEMFGEQTDDFTSGKYSGLSWKQIIAVVRRVEKYAPEPFRLVDRIMVELTDNYPHFSREDLYFSVSARANQGSVIESAGIIAFLINKSARRDRSFTISYQTDSENFHPSEVQVQLTLDPLEYSFPPKEPVLVRERGTDILTLLIKLLQVGDAVWFRLQPKEFGYRVVTVLAKENEGPISLGRSYEMRFTRSLGWYIKAIIPRFSALGGLALPFIRGFLGF